MADIITSLKDHFLIATSELEDSVFDKAIIYIYEHTPEGAAGVIVNHPMLDVTFEQIVNDIGVAANIEGSVYIDIFQGGPVDIQRGFVVHSTDYNDIATTKVSDDVAISTTGDVVAAIANGRGPKYLNFCLGYSGWGPNQLEDEVAENVWLVLPRSNDVLFKVNPKRRYDTAIALLGLHSMPETGNVGIC